MKANKGLLFLIAAMLVLLLIPALGADADPSEESPTGTSEVIVQTPQDEETHNWILTENDGASCSVRGTLTYTCTDCGKTRVVQDVTEPGTHLHTETVTAVPASCGKRGVSEGVRCSDCGAILSGFDPLPALRHSWVCTVRPATLKRDGKRSYVCENCGAKTQKPITRIASVTLSETAIAKDGSKHTPAVTVKDANGKTLKKGVAFTVAYDPGRKHFGTYAVTVTFQGNYAGSKTLRFTIGLDVPQSIEKTNVGATIATLSWNRVRYATGYLLYYAAEKGGPYTRFAETAARSYNISNLQQCTRYYFKIKAIRRETDRLISGPASAPCALRTAKQQLSSAGRILVEITPENRLLAVVNHSREIPASYQPKLAALSEKGKYMDWEAAAAFETMRADAKRENITLNAYSPYRSYAHQKASMESIIRDRQSWGNSRSRAEELALQVVLPPGTSEHNLGLAVDISSTAQTFKTTRAYRWLLKNGQNYGFILRYPDGKQDVTGISFEPWHWRFVGVDNAKKIKKSGLTLEEYTATLTAPY